MKTAGRASLTSQAFWLLFAKTLGFAFTVVLPLILVRALDQVTYGQFRQLFLVINTAGMILPLGVPFSAFYFFPREPQRHRQIVLNIALYHLLISAAVLLVFWLHPRTIVHLVGSEELVRYSGMLGVVLFLTLFSSVAETVATAYQEVKVSTVFIIGANLSKTVLLLGAVLFSRSVEALLISAAIQAALQSLALLWYLNSRFPRFWTDFDRHFFSIQLRYALPLGVSGILLVLQREAHHFYVSSHFGSAAYAIYAIGCFQLPLMGLMRDSVAAVLISRTSEYQKEGRIADIVSLTARSMRKLSLVYWPAIFFLLVWAEDFVVLVFTREYIESVPILQVNLLTLATVIPITDPVFRAFAEHRYFIVRVRFAVLAALVVVLQFGIDRLGMRGTVAAVLTATVVERVIVCWKTMRILGMDMAQLRLFRGTVNTALAAAVAVAPAYGVHLLMPSLPPAAVLIACGSVYMLTYVGLLFTWGFVEPEERQMVSNVVLRARKVAAFASAG